MILILIAALVISVGCIVALQAYVALAVAEASHAYLVELEARSFD